MTDLEREEIVAYHLSKADETLAEAKHLALKGFWNGVANRLYYACFNSVRAILINDLIAVHSHSGLKNQFHENYIKNKILDEKLGEILNRLMNQRDDADYKVKIRFTEEQILPNIEETQKFVDSLKKIIASRKIVPVKT
jgi:uncharacterized protein (UPF0332 family)